MKKLLSIVIVILISLSVFSQVPRSFNFQAVVRDNSGNVVSNQNVGIKISIIPEGTYMLPVYSETHSITTNQFGLISLKVGEGNPIDGEFGNVEWWDGNYFIQTAIDITGGSNYQVMGSTQLVTVPYALYSQGLILTDENGNSHLVTVDSDGNLSTKQVFVKCGDDYTDPRDGTVYGTVQIGNQCWMTENLRYGQFIPSTSPQTDNGVVEVYCYFDMPTACEVGGGLYTWNEMMQYTTDSVNRGICPDGWRLPTDYEWKILEGVADSQYGVGNAVWNQTGWRGTDAGGNLKSLDPNRWSSPNTGATDKFGMNIVGSGLYDGNSFSGISENAYIYTSVETGSGALIRRLDYDKSEIYRDDIPKTFAASVRCISNREFPNEPPSQPSNPTPENGATEQSNVSVLSWECSDPENEPLKYDVYFDTINPPAQVITGQVATTYDPGQLQPGKTYYWKIVAYDYINETEGIIWNFTTTTNLPPAQPSDPNPPDQAGNIDPFNSILSWSCSDPNNDPLTYDVYFGENYPPELFFENIQDTSFDISGMTQMGSTYFWKIVAKDGFNETEGQVWSFTTLMNFPPEQPTNPSPSVFGILNWGDSTLSWTCSDPENDILSYDVYFGMDIETLSQVASNIQDTFFIISDDLTPGYDYFWQIIVHDQYSETMGDIWQFTAGYPPVGEPENPVPPDAAGNVSIFTDLEWDCQMFGNGNEYDFDVYFGTNNPPNYYGSIQRNDYHTVYAVNQLNPGETYYWQVVVNDYYGNSNSGDVWSFTTSSNNPPAAPYGPQPLNELQYVNINDTIFWSCYDQDNDPLTFDVYFGTDQNNIPLVSSSQSDMYYIPGTMQNGTRYYWYIVANDGEYQNIGDIWYFTTGNNTPPNSPSGPVPADGTVDQSVYTVLSWQCSDADGNPLMYDIYFDTDNPPVNIVSSFQTDTVFNPGMLNIGEQYYWKIVAKDYYDQTSGPVWTFTTSSNNPPDQASNPQPPVESFDQSINTVLSWTGTDPDNDPLTYDVYFGTDENNLPLVSSGQSATTYNPGTLEYSNVYYWRITTSDGFYTTDGNPWVFYTVDNMPPDPPANPAPANNTTGVSTSVVLSWSCFDPENDPLTYNVYFGTDMENLPVVLTGQSGTSYDPGTLSESTTYYWYVEADDGYNISSGEIWTFTSGN